MLANQCLGQWSTSFMGSNGNLAAFCYRTLAKTLAMWTLVTYV